jgi:multidrug resistance efflux pump
MKFIIGILLVMVVSAGLFLYLEHSMARIHSVEATINSDSYTVGIDYSSIVEKQYIEESAYVKAGDPLFELRSSSLADAIRNNQVSQGSLLYSVTDQGSILITASAEGRVQSISERVGAFVPANKELAKINLKDGLYINATYKLSSPDYARISIGGKIVVTLPDNTKVDARIYDISLETRDKEVYTTVKARVDQSKINQIVFTAGTPVESVLYLNNDTLLTRIVRYATQVFQPSGR